jgi:hypothetical protein
MQNTDDRQNTLQHERLDAYTVAVELDGNVVGIAHKAGRGHAWIADQAMRASASVVLNFIVHILCTTLRAVAARRWPSAPASGSPKPSAAKARTAPGHSESRGDQPSRWTQR